MIADDHREHLLRVLVWSMIARPQALPVFEIATPPNMATLLLRESFLPIDVESGCGSDGVPRIEAMAVRASPTDLDERIRIEVDHLLSDDYEEPEGVIRLDGDEFGVLDLLPEFFPPGKMSQARKILGQTGRPWGPRELRLACILSGNGHHLTRDEAAHLADMSINVGYTSGNGLLSFLLSRAANASTDICAEVARRVLAVWVAPESGYGERRRALEIVLAGPAELVRRVNDQAVGLLRAGHPVTVSRLRDLFLFAELLRPSISPRMIGPSPTSISS